MTWYNDQSSSEQPWFDEEQPASSSHVFPPSHGDLSASPPKGSGKGALVVAGVVVIAALLVLGVAGALLLVDRNDESSSLSAQSRRSRDRGRRDAEADDRRRDEADPDEGKVVLTGPGENGANGDPGDLSPPLSDGDGRSGPSSTPPGELSLDDYAQKLCEEVMLPGYAPVFELVYTRWPDWFTTDDPNDLSSSEVEELRRTLIAFFEEVQVAFVDIGRFNDRYRVQGQDGLELQQALKEHVQAFDDSAEVLKIDLASSGSEALVELARDLSSSGSPGSAATAEGFDGSEVSAQLSRALHDVDPGCVLG